MLPDFSQPQPAAIERISPTAANDLLACKLRVGFGRDPSYMTWRRPTPATVLGQASHHVIEQAYRSGDVAANHRKQVLHSEWEEAIQAGARELAKAWTPAEPPPPEHWPGYQLTRARILRRATRISETRVERKMTADHVGGDGGLEVWLDAPDLRLFGRVDRIDRVGGRLRIIDLKSGVRTSEPNPDHVRQLLLYVALVHADRGDWADEVVIENTSGEQHVMEVDRVEVQDVVVEVASAIDQFNELVTNHSLEPAARPDPERCRFCAYRVVCRPYWTALTTQWGHRSILGEVMATSSDKSHKGIIVRVESPFDAQDNLIQVTGVPAAVNVTEPWFAGINLEAVNGRNDLRATWASVMRTW